MSCKTVTLALMLAISALLGTACGSDQQEREFPARPGENPAGYEQQRDPTRLPMQPEAPAQGFDQGQSNRHKEEPQERSNPFSSQPD